MADFGGETEVGQTAQALTVHPTVYLPETRTHSRIWADDPSEWEIRRSADMYCGIHGSESYELCDCSAPASSPRACGQTSTTYAFRLSLRGWRPHTTPPFKLPEVCYPIFYSITCRNPTPPPPTSGLQVQLRNPTPVIQWGGQGSAEVEVRSVGNFSGAVGLEFNTTSPSGDLGLDGSFSPASVNVAPGGTAISTLRLSTTERGTRIGTLQYRVRAFQGTLGTTTSGSVRVDRRRGIWTNLGGRADFDVYPSSRSCTPPGLERVVAEVYPTASQIRIGNDSPQNYVNSPGILMSPQCTFVVLQALTAHLNFVRIGFPDAATGGRGQLGSMVVTGFPQQGNTTLVDIYGAPDGSGVAFAVSRNSNPWDYDLRICDVLRGGCHTRRVGEIASITQEGPNSVISYRGSSNGPIQRVDVGL